MRNGSHFFMGGSGVVVDFGAEQSFEAEAEAFGFLGDHGGILADQAAASVNARNIARP